jgi:hypothetical protein
MIDIRPDGSLCGCCHELIQLDVLVELHKLYKDFNPNTSKLNEKSSLPLL